MYWLYISNFWYKKNYKIQSPYEKEKTKKIVIKNTNNIQVEYNLIYGPLN